MKIHNMVLSCLIATSSITIAQDKPSPEAEALFTKMMSQINPRHVQWVQRTAKETNDSKLDSNAVTRKAKEYAVLGNMNGQDIEALAFLVLMQAAKSAQEDLKAIMAQVKAINNAKQKTRNVLNSIQSKQRLTTAQLDSVNWLKNTAVAVRNGQNPDAVKFRRTTTSSEPATKADINTVKEEMKKTLDSMSEMGEMESLKLQMAMDRMSKMMSTISNILKKIRSTQDSIIQNLK